MKVGLLWFDDDPHRSLEDKVLKATLRYRRKYSHSPNLCFVHRSAFGDGKSQVGEVGGDPSRSLGAAGSLLAGSS